MIRIVFKQCLDTGIWEKAAEFTIEHLCYYDYDDPIKGFFSNSYKLKEIEQPTVKEACRQSRIFAENLFEPGKNNVKITTSDAKECVWYNGNWVQSNLVIQMRYCD